MSNQPTRQDLESQISELKRQNEILSSRASFQNLESEKYAHTIFNNMGDAVFVKNHKSELVLVNDAFCEMLKLPRAEIIGKTLAENVPPHERETFLRIDNEVLLNGIENINEESLTIENNTRLISTRKSRFIDSNGEKFLVGVIRDISERKKAEKALKESETQLRELNTTKDKMFSIIAHDLRSPFSNITGLSELIIDNLNNNENAVSKDYIELINSISKNALALLDNLLNWARSQTGELNIIPEKVSLSKVIYEIIELENSFAKAKTITISYSPANDDELFIDKNVLRIIIRNLISNAIKFTNTEGEITVLTSVKNHQLEISVSDNGVGLNEETINKLFDISTNITSLGTANEKGSGLGLVLCNEFVKKLNGHIVVDSEVGKGSNFNVTLPLSDSK
ncbi:PAS domain S-box protein [Aurantibacter crassamenti]|uniref:two-component system sensor histidine kinase NtrB n=1 Tax=Aurantibacter crassamenti TaxID=1837375 RepID=UPI001939C863|nr:PAS domain-containing sensor histidine kinase [Aurantibacter crassamenti]MBM1105017.1 PAS domain S-box protein [Aurantibacter crassamenti]